MKNFTLNNTFTLIVLLTPLLVKAQRPHGRSLEGLPSKLLYQSQQDKQGYFWQPTDQGVARFNGNSWHTFSVADGLISNDNYGLFEDAMRNIWFINSSSRNELCYYDPKKAAIQKITIDYALAFSSLPQANYGGKTLQFTPLDNGYFLLSCAYVSNDEEHGIFSMFRSSAEGIKQLPLPKKFVEAFEKPHWNINRNIGLDKLQKTFYRFINGNWQAVGRYSREYPGSTTKFTPAISPENYYSLTDTSFLIHRTNIQKKDTLTVWHIKGKRLFERTFNDRIVVGDRLNSPNNPYFWGVTQGRTLFFDFSLQPIQQDIFSNTHAIKYDRQGNSWQLSASRDSLRVYSPVALAWSQHWNLPNGEEIRKMVIDAYNRLWIGTNKGRLFVKLPHQNSLQEVRLASPHSFAGQYIRGMAIFQNALYMVNNQLLVGFDIGSPKLSSPVVLGQPLQLDNSNHIASKGNKYGSGSFKNVKIIADSLYVSCSGETIRLHKEAVNSLGVKIVNNGKSFVVAHDGINVWYGKPDGLYRNNETKPISLIPNKEIKDLAVDAHKNLWVATEVGLYQYNNQKVTFMQSVGNTYINSLTIDPQQRVWIATQNKGLLLLQNNHVRRLGEYYGVPDAAVYSCAIKDSLVYVGTAKGLTVLNNPLSRPLPKPDSLRVDMLTVSSADRSVTIPRVTQNIRLAYNENNLRFKVLDFNYIEQKNYTFLLVRQRFFGGQDTLQTTESAVGEYSTLGLGAGKYNLVCLRHGLESGLDTTHVHHFEIERPFWLRWWFIALMGMAIGTLTYIVLLRSKLRRSSLELSVLQGQMNAHFVANFMEGIKGVVIRKETRVAFDLLSNFSKLMRDFVTASRMKTIDIETEKKYLDNYVDLAKKTFEMTDDGPKPLKYDGMDISRVNSKTKINALVIQPIVENAIYHGITHKNGPATLKVWIEPFDKKTISCFVQDDGVGVAEVERIKRAEGLTKRRDGTWSAMRKAGIPLIIHEQEMGVKIEIRLSIQ